MTSVHELLERGAAVPSVPFDVDATTRSAGRRRRNRRGTVAALVVVLVGVAAFVVADLDRDASRSVVVPPAASGLEPLKVPDDWTPVSDSDAGIAMAIPPGWSVQPKDTTDGPARSIVVVGSSSRSRVDTFVAACEPTDAIPSQPGTWVSLYEYSFSGPAFLPAGDGISLGARAFVERPVTFVDADTDGSHCGPDGARKGPIENSAELFPFRDGDRLFLARIVTVGDPDRAGQRLGREVLDTLRVAPVGNSASVPPVTATPTPTSADDEHAARDVALAWLDPPRVADIEGIEEISGLLRDERSRSDDVKDLAAFHGDLDDLTVDGTRAAFHYTLYERDALLQANVPGTLVKIDGRWRISRETECDLVARVGVTCPARGEPSSG